MSRTTLVRSTPATRRSVARAVGLAAALASATLLIACGGGSAEPATEVSTTGTTGSDVAGGGAAEGYPVTVENCGRELTFDAPPERAVSLWQAPTEMMLALGAQDDVVAVAGSYAPLPADLADRAEGIEVIGSSMGWPSREVLLSQSPDLVVSQVLEGFAFDTASGYASVEQLEDSGIQVYGANACDLAEIRAMTVDTPAQTLTDLGAIFGRSAEAAEIVAGLEAQKAAVIEAVAGLEPVRTAFYQGGTGPVHVLADGIYDSAIETAGGENVFAEEADVSNEEFSAIDAEVLLVGTYEGQDFATASAFLEENFPDVPAVADGRLVELPVAETDASLRVMDGLTRIAAGLHPEAGLTVPTE